MTSPRRIAHDTSRCAGLGVCESIAPEIFEINDHGELVLRVAEVNGDDGDDIARVDEAIESCPTQALSWSE